MFGQSRFEKRVKELEESLARIEHAFKKLEIEWTETYDKFRQLHWRVAKRVKQLEESPETGGGEESEAVLSPPDQHGLTPHQSKIQLEILTRRNRRRVGERNGGG